MIFGHSVVRKPNSPKGLTNQPKAKDRSNVDVVRPSRADAATARDACRQTKVPCRRPSKESQLKPHSVRPEEKKRCIKKVKSNNQRSTQRSRRICREKGLTVQAATTTAAKTGANCIQPEDEKEKATRSRQAKIFKRGSTLCRIVPACRYKPFSADAIKV